MFKGDFTHTHAGENQPTFTEWELVPRVQQTKAYSAQALHKYQVQG